MIEEIVEPFAYPAYVLVLSGVILLIMSLTLRSLYDDDKLFPLFFVLSVTLIVSSVFILPYYESDWILQVKDQVNSLPCESLEEAYEIYDMEFIKEKFIDECLPDELKVEWWKLD